MWVVSQGHNTEFPKVYNSVNYTVDYRNVNICRCTNLSNIAYIIVYKGSHGDYNVNYVVQIITSTGVNISVNYLQSCTPLEILCFGPVFAYGNEPTIYKYDQPRYVNILHKICAQPVHIFCKCRIPDNGKEKMIQCDSCSEWYHQSCEIVDSNLFKYINTVWSCSKCNKYTF